jgi:enoyl-CoA hydratase
MEKMSYTTITYEREAPVGIITLNRPEVMNAINDQMANELYEVLYSIENDQEVRAVILTGAGKAFMAGGDIALMQQLTTPQAKDWALLVHKVFDQLYRLPQPTIAAVNGPAIGGGFELAMACDLRIAIPPAKFAQPEINLGIIPGAGSTQRLPRLIGGPRAKAMIILGETLTAEQALELGVINKVVPREELLQEAKTIADKIAAYPRLAAQCAKKAVNLADRTDLDLGQALEIDLYSYLYSTSDQKEGMLAFLEKRKPNFTHR